MATLDIYIVNVALPAISAAFSGRGLAAVSWVLNGYTIVFAAVMVPAGRLADHFGRHRMLLAGMVIFAIGSAACAAAPTLDPASTRRRRVVAVLALRHRACRPRDPARSGGDRSVSVNAARVTRRFGRTAPAIVGLVMFGLAAVIWLSAARDHSSYATTFLPALLVAGVGAGLAQAPLPGSAGPLPPARFSTGSAVLNMSRQIGPQAAPRETR